MRPSRFMDPYLVTTVAVERVNGDRQGTLRVGNDTRGGSSVCVEADNGHDDRCHVWLTQEEACTLARGILEAYDG